MTICAPLIASRGGLFWSTFESYHHSAFILQQYSGPVWWRDKFRILLLIDGGVCSYIIATSSNREDIVANWSLVKSLYEERVQKTGLNQFSETFLLNIYKKLYKKLYKLSTIPTTTNNNNNHSHRSSVKLQNNDFCIGHVPNNLHQLSQSRDHVGHASGNGSSAVIGSGSAGASMLNITLGKQRRITLLFKELYQSDNSTFTIEKLNMVLAKILPTGGSEWMEWQEEGTGMRPIHVAVQGLNTVLVKYLIDSKVDTNIKDIQGWSPLHFAAFSGALDICQMLIEEGNAAVLSISKDGTLPLHYLAKHSFTKQNSAKFHQILELLLTKGTPIDAKTIRGESALHRACYLGSIQVATFLIEKNADLDIQNVRGETPLYYSVVGGHKQIAKLLIENGANPQIGGATGNSIDAARSTNQTDLLCYLISFQKDSQDSAGLYQDDDEDDEDEEDETFHHDHGQDSPTGKPKVDLRSSSGSAGSTLSKPQMNQSGEKPFYPHVFIFNDFKSPTWCSYCSYYMYGIRRQGYTCETCGYNVHPKCKKKATLKESCEVAATQAQMHHSSNHRHQDYLSDQRLTSSVSSNSSLSSSVSVDDILQQTTTDYEQQPLHKKRINRKRLESLYNHFNALDKDQTGAIFKKEFGESLGSILNDSNTLSNALFTAFDSNNDGRMDLRDFLNGISILQNSPFNIQLKFAFKMLDKDSKGYFTVNEFLNVLNSIQASLDSLKILTINPVEFLKSIFPEKIYAIPLNKSTQIGLHRGDSTPSSSTSTSPSSFTPNNSTGDLATLPSNTFTSPSKQYSWIHQNSNVRHSQSLPSLPSIFQSQSQSLPNLPVFTKSDLKINYLEPLNMDGKIYFKDYRRAIMKNKLFIQSLGLVKETMDEDALFKNKQIDSEQQPTPTINNMKWINFEGKEITLGHENWETMQCIMIGIRRAIGESITLPTRPLKPKDFDVVSEFKYNGWIFRDNAPLPFKRIRDRLEIDTKFFMYTLGPEKIFGNLLLGNLSVLCEVMSSGRSGSMFFRSNEGRYLIKTIPPNEEVVLKNILPTYVQHIHKYPNTFLTKVLGCYNINLKSSKDLILIVMNNLFYTPLPIHEKYDLKGSTIGRHVEQVSQNELNIAEIALKDLDFKRKLNIGPTLKAALMEQIEHDTKFLESHNICDYSLLVGVHRIDEHSPLTLPVESGGIQDIDQFDLLDQGFFKKQSGKVSLFNEFYGGIFSIDKKEVYFISIIDTFTTWDFRKKYENMFKSLVHDSSQISAIEPISYRKRFQKLVSTIVE